MSQVEEQDLFAGMSGLNLGDKIIEFGHGIVLRETYAHIFSTDILSFKKPSTRHDYHPGPWQANSAREGVDITAELHIPREYSHHSSITNFQVAHTIVTLLRIWADPEITLLLTADRPIPELMNHKYTGPNAEGVAFLLSGRDRHIHLALQSREKVIENIGWVVEHWENALNLISSSPEFAFSLSTFDNAQLIPDRAMMLVSIWGALEAIFAQSNAELRFRVSAQIAAFLKPRGLARWEKQKEVLKLYDKRSAAAHGTLKKHDKEDLVKTFELLRAAIIGMIERKRVPTKSDLEENAVCQLNEIMRYNITKGGVAA